MQRMRMLLDARARDSASQNFAKAAEAGGDEARQEMINTFDRMAAQCKEWLAANGEPQESGPVRDKSDIDPPDHTRSVQVPTNVPANVEELGLLNELYVAEGNLLNNTQRALMEHYLRFGQKPDDAAATPVSEVMKIMQAFSAKVRGFVLTDFRTLAYVLTSTAVRPMS